MLQLNSKSTNIKIIPPFKNRIFFITVYPVVAYSYNKAGEVVDTMAAIVKMWVHAHRVTAHRTINRFQNARFNLETQIV